MAGLLMLPWGGGDLVPSFSDNLEGPGSVI